LVGDHIDSTFKNLVIIPDGILNGLSFESLETVDGRFLIEEHACSYAFGVNTAMNWSLDRKKISNASFLSYSNESTIQDMSPKEYLELNGALNEVNKCADILDGLQSKVYSGLKCTKNNMEKALSADIVHFATHAVSNPLTGTGNYFVTRAKNRIEKMYGYEFNKMNANSSLAVLSACETGVGKFVSGEGIYSLSRNLMRSGVPTVVKTLWQVDDNFSAQLVQYFYTNVAEGKDLISALQLAKIQFISDHNPDPYFWSSYVLEGNPFVSFEMQI
jgi:CHAT domain-containing protein